MTGAVMIHLQRALATGLRTSSSTCYLGKASAMGWCVGMRPVCHDNERRSACSSDDACRRWRAAQQHRGRLGGRGGVDR